MISKACQQMLFKSNRFAITQVAMRTFATETQQQQQQKSQQIDFGF